MKKIFLAIIALAFFNACHEEDIDIFSVDDTGIYFQSVGSTVTTNAGSKYMVYRDSLSFSFAGVSANKKTLTYSAQVYTMGKVKDYDRKFKVIIDDESSAIRGMHYDVNLDTLVIKAGKNTGRVPVTFYRTDDLMVNTMRLKIRLEENENFKLSIQDYKASSQWNQNSGTLSGLTWVFRFNEQYNKPSYWSFFGDGFFGQWTPKKYLTLNTVMGWTVSDWNNAGSSGSKVSYGRMGFAAKEFQKYLQQMADDGTPETDMDGTYMQLPSPYNVDYSMYEK